MSHITTDLAINESLTEMNDSLTADLQMLRNYRAELVKKQRFDRIDLLRDVELKTEMLIQAIASALR